MAQHTFGVIGTGHFASYTIKALRAGGNTDPIVLSPRNADYAAALARDQGCRVAEDNAAVVAAADTVLLAVRPHQLDAALADLRFRPEQTVLSSLAGVPLATLHDKGLPAHTVRIMPSSFVEAGDAVFPLFPPSNAVEQLFAAAGRVVVFDDETAFERSVLIACAHAWCYALLAHMTDWFSEHGWPEDVARDMVVRHLRGTTTYALAHPDTPFDAILEGIATDGTFTLAGLEHLHAQDAFRPWSEAFARLDRELNPN
ncbi:MAG: NAD(P)-binding domain-containing protein [Pseudomonadota bacterium]